MQLRDVMSHDVEIIHPECSLVDAARKMKDFDAGPVLVGDDSEIIGMITDRDIATRAIAEGRDPNSTQVREIMTRGTVYCFEDEEIEEAVRIMRQRHLSRLQYHFFAVTNDSQRNRFARRSARDKNR